MKQETLTLAMERVRALAAQESYDPRVLFDQVQIVIDRLEAERQPVPRDLRQSAAELEGEIVDAFFDNLPV